MHIVYYILAVIISIYGIIGLIPRLKVKSYTVYTQKINKNIRIVQLSDLHSNLHGKNNIKLINKIKDLKPDIIVITGDMLISYKPLFKDHDDGSVFLELLKKIKDIGKCYYVLGNHELRLLDEKGFLNGKYDYKNEIEKHGASFLDNDHIKIGGINLYGLNIPLSAYKRKRKDVLSEKYYGKKNFFFKEINKEEFNILLAHTPEYFESYEKAGMDLVLSGHIHGGMINLPIIKGLFSPDYFLFPKRDKGEYKSNNCRMIISAGLSYKPFRFYNDMEIVCVDIRAER